MNAFSKIGISALLTLLTLSTASAMNPPQEEDTESTNNSVNTSEVQPNEALMQAVQSGDLNAVKNIEPNATLKELEYAINLALDIDNAAIFIEIFNYIEMNDLDSCFFIQESYLIEKAAENNKPEVFRYLIDITFGENYFEASQCLFLAASEGHLNIIKILEEYYFLDELDEDDDGLGDALIAACKDGHINVMNYLLEKYSEYYKENSNAIGLSIHHNTKRSLKKHTGTQEIFYLLSQYATLKDIGDYLIIQFDNKCPFTIFWVENKKIDLKNIEKLPVAPYVLSCIIQKNKELKNLIKTDEDFKKACIELHLIFNNFPLLNQTKNDLHFGINKIHPKKIDYFGKPNLNNLKTTAAKDVFGRTPAQLNELKTIIDTPYQEEQ